MAIYTIQLKRGKSSSWTSLNPVLKPGEPGFEMDTGKLKIGNGTNDWKSLPYVGEDKKLVITANTVLDFPPIGEVDVLYKASQEKQLYQWNDSLNSYEVFLRNDLVTQEQLEEAIDKIGIPEVVLEDYATKDYVNDIVNQMTALTREEILEICK